MEKLILRRTKTDNEAHAVKLAQYVEVIQNWDFEQSVSEIEKNVSKDLKQLMTETTNNPFLLRTQYAENESTMR